MHVFKYPLVIACLFAASCGKEKAATSGGQQDPAKAVEYQLVSDGRFFSKPVGLPTGEVTDEQRVMFAKELESAIDGAKTNYKVVAVRAEAPGKVVIALYARGGMTRADCESLAQSAVIQRAAVIGFRTFACEDKSTPLLFSTPITNKRGELVIDEKGEIRVVPAR